MASPPSRRRHADVGRRAWQSDAMHLSLILDMAADALGDRRAVTAPDGTITYAELRERADALAGSLAGERAVQLGLNSLAVPVDAVRRGARRRRVHAAELPPRRPRPRAHRRRGPRRRPPSSTTTWSAAGRRSTGCRSSRRSRSATVAADATSSRTSTPTTSPILLFTSGTTGEPKAAVLRHRHVTSYVMGTLEFAAAGEEEATLVSVPPYHIAGISADRVVDVRRPAHRLPRRRSTRGVGRRRRPPRRSPTPWSCRRCSGGSSTCWRPTASQLPALRHLSYGGGRMPVPVIERALRADAARRLRQRLRPHRDELDDRRARARRPPRGARQRRPGRAPPPRLGRATLAGDRGDDPRPVRRGGPAGRVRRDLGARRAGVGRVRRARRRQRVVRHPRRRLPRRRAATCSSRAASTTSSSAAARTSRRARSRTCCATHAGRRRRRGVGIPSQEWGEDIGASVVLIGDVDVDELREWVRARLRSTRVPALVEVRTELPYNETGKLLRRVLKAEATPL